MTAGNKIRVLIVDDSALVRKLLTELLAEDPAIEVCGTASDPLMARDKIKELNPDVLTLDVEMPRMDGVTFLRNLMRLRPMPVLMVSSLTENGADVTLEALELGAVDFVTKPKIDLAHSLADYREEIVSKIKVAARARVKPLDERAPPARIVTERFSADAILGPPTGRRMYKTTDSIIAIGASTGGTEAIKDVLAELPGDMPGIVITQHIPAAFSLPFSKRMDTVSAMNVCQAEDGQQILPGHVYIAPGDKHLMVTRSGARYICKLDDGPPVNRHKPSVDVLFRSVALNAGPNAIGAILTGMGDDGARGLKEILDAGGRTVAQDEASSVVWGMPGSAVAAGGAQSVLPLNRIATHLVKLHREFVHGESVAHAGNG